MNKKLIQLAVINNINDMMTKFKVKVTQAYIDNAVEYMTWWIKTNCKELNKQALKNSYFNFKIYNQLMRDFEYDE